MRSFVDIDRTPCCLLEDWTGITLDGLGPTWHGIYCRNCETVFARFHVLPFARVWGQS